MKLEFSNKRAHDLCRHPNLVRDFKGSLERMEDARPFGK